MRAKGLCHAVAYIPKPTFWALGIPSSARARPSVEVMLSVVFVGYADADVDAVVVLTVTGTVDIRLAMSRSCDAMVWSCLSPSLTALHTRSCVANATHIYNIV